MKTPFSFGGNYSVNELFTVLCLAGLVAACSLPSAAQTGSPSREPMLRVETGMHTAGIRRIGVDKANRYLVTASDDKTVRVWEVSTGRLLRVIRPPIGDGEVGKVYSVAISPDGQTIAAGGWNAFAGEKSDSIYLFDRESGKLTRRITGLPDVTYHLRFSRDGRYLAATLGGRNGVRVYDANNYTLVGEDTEYGDGSYGADFDAGDRLATTSLDGYIRLYQLGGASLRLLLKMKPEGGSRPYGVSFSPDGSRIAVGFDDSARVAVLSGQNLSLLYFPDAAGIGSGTLGRIAWSADGKTLFAGGGYGSNGSRLIRAWTNGGRGSYQDIPAAGNTILDILALRTGGVVYGTYDPSFGIISASGRRTLFVGPTTADYRDNTRGFLLSPDGATVQFGYEQFGKSPARFSLLDRRLETAPPSAESLRPPITEAEGLTVTDWLNSYTPKVNGKTLQLEEYEFSRSLAFTPDEQQFVLGTEYNLRLFDRNGAARGKIAAPGIAWAVNLSANGKLVVAAFGDGTIRWYRFKDGKELLAFFPHADRKRWVLWTPSGYYDAAPESDSLIGWHVNRSHTEAADFFPVGQFRATFYRPDVIARVLETGDEGEALRLANEEAGRAQQSANVAQMLPPVVEIISPADAAVLSSQNVTVRYRVRTPRARR